MAQYAEITKIEAPNEAAAGSQVTVTVKVKNLYHEIISIKVDGAVEYGDYMPYPGIYFPQEWANVPAYTTHSFAGSFTMPDEDVTLRIRSRWYGADDIWYFDDEKTKNVEVAGAGVEGWYEADVWTLSITRGPELVEGWYQADVRVIYVNKGPALVEGWYQADVKTIIIAKGTELVEGWYQADVKIITVTRPGGEPPDGDEEGKFPWGVALIAAGGIVALAAAAMPKGKKSPKPKETVTPKKSLR